ncbi:hypothetical protein MJO28_012852 [Puccinia striiformis f. sp. tritici]|uniref:Uncharacterized protein n=3 Tax=Puccinia striiformis TaxID=27350 RepID=A0A0L0VME0_9BASI|nr:hypothetical protein MJO28_012852 [Puccinia striiformis f. sp. tritici]KAI9625300.1 hypothetical protein H4Q26_016322 [Puccinia striiformis f. sp. tritici PST-130]KNF00421.1 hypothetical protein PSTG_06350 [Puccinia striiformis f. sp. tritici PST-78]POV97794.1 hypothetical protein PSHT_14389 [Puccinia striiformis]KAI7943374.1 hypothetical protein MJO29_013218 [Puccinia striiformis f. sp. tritici]
MFAFKDSTRILSIGMITTLSIALINAHVCYNAYQTVAGGWNPGDGKAMCGDGTRTYQCTLSACISVHQTFQRCSTNPLQVPGNMNVRVVSYTLINNVFSVSTDTPGQRIYCPNDVENQVKITVCPDADCDGGI